MSEEVVSFLVKIAIALAFSIPFFYYVYKSKKNRKNLVDLVAHNFPELVPSEGLYSQDGIKFLGFNKNGDVGFISLESKETEIIRKKLTEIHDIEVYVNDFLAGGNVSGVTIDSIQNLWRQGPAKANDSPTLHVRIRFIEGERYIRRKIYAIEKRGASKYGEKQSAVFQKVVDMVSVIKSLSIKSETQQSD